MGEIYLCKECHQRVDRETDEYVIPNKASARSKSQWVYSHARCVEGKGPLKRLSDAEVYRLIEALLEDRIADMDPQILRRLGLHRIAGGDRAQDGGA